MLRVFPRLCLLAVLLTACSAAASPIPTPTKTAAPLPTMTPIPTPFRILAYATDGIVESIIPYDQLTHINYAFLTPKEDGTFNPFSNGSKLRQIVANGHSRNVKVM